MQEYNGYNGLSQKEVADRIEKGLCNISNQSVGKSIKRIIITNTFTYFNFIFAVITVLLCLKLVSQSYISADNHRQHAGRHISGDKSKADP